MSTSLFLNYVYTCFPKLPWALFNSRTRNVKRTSLLILWLFDVCGTSVNFRYKHNLIYTDKIST